MLTYDKKYFEGILNESRSECLKYSLPRKDEIVKILHEHQEAFEKRDAAEKRKNQLKKKKAPAADVTAAIAEFKELKDAANKQVQKTIAALEPILTEDVRLDLEPESRHVHLMKSAIVTQSNPKQLEEFCKNNDPTYIVDLLENEDMMKEMLVNGGAKKGLFAEAYKMFDELMEMIEDDDDDCHRRLALGTALELVVPVTVFGTKSQTIDPKKRFMHYVQAHKNGELDPSFPYFTVWEYRHIVNGDATNEELQWGRDQLKRYRPDLLNPGKSHMKYCKQVKTDVAYQRPEWGEGRKTFKMLISGGGKCGPRAWMGRFLCRAFGVPTWGIRQPGHAALARWTPDVGWDTCLGGGIGVGWWEGRGGDDFKHEAHSRHFQKDPEKYFLKVTLLQCMAQAYQEKSIARDANTFGPSTLWNSLTRVQMRSWTHDAKKVKDCYRRDPKDGEDPEDCTIRTFLSRTDDPTDDNQVEIVESGQVCVPACAFVRQQGVAVHRCFEGGGQVHFQKDSPGAIVYKLPSSVPKKQYELTFKICTLHLEQELDLLCASINGSEACEVPVLYTVGEWARTDPVKIELGKDDELRITRKSEKGKFWGLTLRELLLKPAEE